MVVDLSLNGILSFRATLAEASFSTRIIETNRSGTSGFSASGLRRVTVAPEPPANEPAELLSPRMVARGEADETDGLTGVTEGERIHADRPFDHLDPAPQARRRPLTVSDGLRRMEQAGRLWIAEEIRPCVDVVFGQEAEVEARCLQTDFRSIERPDVASRPCTG